MHNKRVRRPNGRSATVGAGDADRSRRLEGSEVKEVDEEDAKAADHYYTAISDDEKLVRLILANEKSVLGHLTMSSDECYEMAQELLHCYDIMEKLVVETH
jgi:hypothetical protein